MGKQNWKPVLVGIDASSEAQEAARFGWKLAQATGAQLVLVHAVREFWIPFADEQLGERTGEIRRALLDTARAQVTTILADSVPTEVQERMIVRFGRAPLVLRQAAEELGAGLVILGGKHHSVLDRWTGGSTSHNSVRTLGLPVLVVAKAADQVPRRIMVAVDVSQAAGATIATAERYAATFGAELKVLSVIEPPVVLPEVTPPFETADFYAMAEEALEQRVWPQVHTTAERVVRYGQPVESILREAHEWNADLVIVGSHGKGWGERLMLGSVTERLLSHLPTSLLVIPAKAERVVTETVPEMPVKAKARTPRKPKRGGALAKSAR
ncbi:MAG TPA: universal stress protein [Gemmatimonadales bacterium]|nr:universal stress protein [Gemmatimonadales bacterium]